MNKTSISSVVVRSISQYRRYYSIVSSSTTRHHHHHQQESIAAMSDAPEQPVPGTLKDGLKDGWFTELSTMWPGQGMSFKVNEVVHTATSDFQVRWHASDARLSRGLNEYWR
jgi:hypothetical protein